MPTFSAERLAEGPKVGVQVFGVFGVFGVFKVFGVFRVFGVQRFLGVQWGSWGCGLILGLAGQKRPEM